MGDLVNFPKKPSVELAEKSLLLKEKLIVLNEQLTKLQKILGKKDGKES